MVDVAPDAAVAPRAPRPPVLISAEPVSGSVLVVAQRDVPGATRLDLAIDAPAFAGSEMQVSLDGSFADALWAPLAATVSIDSFDVGYQTVFVRFRRAGGPATRPLVRGVSIDPTRAAAIASVSGRHRPSFIGRVAANQLVVEVETGRIDQTPGGLVMTGKPLNVQLMANALTVSTDSESLILPNSVVRTSRPRGGIEFEDRTELSMVHQFFITLPTAMTDGVAYTVTDRSGNVEPVTFTFDPAVSRSPAVQANQLGYAVTDVGRFAYLSNWSAAGGVDYESVRDYAVVNSATGSIVAKGTPRRRVVPADGEYGKGDLTWAGVWELDLSSIVSPGIYRVCVPTVGCSWDFPVTASGSWLRAASTVARAMFHQRSGIQLGAPYTSVNRPRPAHPDDGLVVNATDYPMELTANGLSEDEATRFEPANKAVSKAVVEGAWGGHMDAGDWDRRVQHVWYLRSVVELLDEFPETVERLELDIPESGDGVPDLLDEGLWSLDLYRRMQTPEGGIRGGIEYDDGPRAGETSWENKLSAYAYAPDAFSSYLYAAGAADAARTLRTYAPDRADGYATSAARAMRWARTQSVPAEFAEQIDLYRVTAAAALYRMDGAVEWHREFLLRNPLTEGPREFLACHGRDICDAAYDYVRSTDRPRNQAVLSNALESIRLDAEAALEGSESTAYGWTIDHPYVPLIWGLGPSTPKVTALLRGYLLFSNMKYREAATRSAAFTLGANPLDQSFVTGLGRRNPVTPLIVDTRVGGIPVWPGTPVYGLHTLSADDEWLPQYILRPNGVSPDPAGVPFVRSWYDVPQSAANNEFTVHQSHARAVHAYGALAGLAARPV